MMTARILDQRGVHKIRDHIYPVFNTPTPPINIGDTVVIKYADESTEVLTIRTNDSIIAPRCTLCKYGSKADNCPIHRDTKHDTWDCIFSRGYAVSVTDLLEEL